MRKEKQRILIAAFLAGVVSILYELVWVRYLGLILGNSVYAVGVVTACYMTGLALGDFCLGGWSVRNASRAKAVTLGGLAVCCFLSPLLYKVIHMINQLGASAFAVSGSARLFWRVGISFLVLLIPASFIGGVLPVLIGAAEGHDGAVYTANTLGSVIGAVFTGFFLIRKVGLVGSMVLAGVIMVLAVLIVRDVKLSVREYSEKNSTVLQQSYSDRVKKMVLAVYCISGFTGMAFQVYQTRILTLFFMDSVYDFAVILAVYLTGLFLGNAISSAWAGRTKHHPEILAVSQMVLGLCSVLSLYLVSCFPYWTEGLTSQSGLYERFGDSFFLIGILIKAGFTALLLLVPAILWGMAYPMVGRICMSGGTEDGKIAGRVLGWNTVGSAVGSLMASFVLIGALGIQRAVMVNGCLNLIGGILLFWFLETLPKRQRTIVPWAATGLALVILLGVPAWDRFEMSTSFLKPGQDVEGYVDIRYYKEDVNGITSVVDFLPYDETYLTTNRLYCQNTSNMTGSEDHRRLSYIPLMLHPSPENVLVEGLGAGITLSGAAEYGNLQIDCVEISSAVAEAARLFEEKNHHVLDSEQVNLLIDDARNYLTTTDQSYDVIIADIFFPMSSGSSNMFSQEYYESCLNHLKEDGLMVQWIPLHQFSPQELEITMKTYAEVFPHATVWFGMIGKSVPVVGLIGSCQPLSISFDRIAAFYDGRTTHQMDLTNTALDDPYMFLSHFVKHLEPEMFGADVPCNTDDRPILEYLNPTGAVSYKNRGLVNVEMLLQTKESAAGLVDFGMQGSAELLTIYEQGIDAFIREIME